MVGCYNSLFRACVANAPPAEFNAVLDDLVCETALHFIYEESLMADACYPDLPLHKAEHEVLLKSAHMLQKKSASEAGRVTNSDALAFLWQWLTDHIGTADRQFGLYFHCAAGPAERHSFR